MLWFFSVLGGTLIVLGIVGSVLTSSRLWTVRSGIAFRFGAILLIVAFEYHAFAIGVLFNPAKSSAPLIVTLLVILLPIGLLGTSSYVLRNHLREHKALTRAGGTRSSTGS
jgi:hypothetical protein